jgi:chaperonin GroES
LVKKGHFSTSYCVAHAREALAAQARQTGENRHEVPAAARPRDDCRIDPAAKTTGGIIIPDTAQEKPMEGEVVAAGPGARNEKGALVPLSVKAGDRILFGKWSGTEIKLDGEDLLIMAESDIMGVIDAPSIVKKKAA